MSRFPAVTETFILREVIEMERQGQPVRLVPLLRGRPAVVHREAVPWIRRALYTPFLSAEIVAANLRVLRRRPLRYGAVLARTLLGAAHSPNLLVRTAALLPKSVYLAERLRAEGIRHVHAHFATHPATVAMVAAELGGLDFSFTAHAHDIFVRRALLEPKLRRASFIRLISEYNRAFLERLYPGALGDRARVIHVGIDPGRYAGTRPHRRTRPGATPLLLCVAAFKPYKGIPVLLEACARLERVGVRFRCELVGDGPLRGEVERRVAALGLETVLRLRGALPQDEVARRLARAHALVLPSIVAADGQMEGIPVALMESMAAGVPVVASALSGIPELVHDGVDGLLVPPGDAAALAAALRHVLEEPGLAQRLGARGRETVARGFRIDRCVAALLAEIDRVRPAPDPDLADAVRAAVDGATGTPRGIGIRGVREGRDSRVVELVIAGEAGPVERVLKTHRTRPGESAPAAERARREFETLCRLHDAFEAGAPSREDAVRPTPAAPISLNGRGCGPFVGLGATRLRPGVPRPLVLDEERATILMERCPGAPLDALIRSLRGTRDRTDRQTLVSAIRAAGRWLDAFHRRTARGGDAGPLFDALVETAAADLAVSRVLRGAAARSALDRLRRLREAVDPAAQRVVGQHGDFWPGNIFVGADAVHVIDFEGHRPGLAYEDVACFLVQLRPFLAFPAARGRAGELQAAFLDAYVDGGRADPASLALCLAAKALAALARDREAGLRGPGEWRRRRTLLRYLRGGGA